MFQMTLRAWFDYNENLSLAAEALGIHRNSLDYRLKRIEEITGFDLTKTQDRFLLYISSVLNQPLRSMAKPSEGNAD